MGRPRTSPCSPGTVGQHSRGVRRPPIRLTPPPVRLWTDGGRFDVPILSIVSATVCRGVVATGMARIPRFDPHRLWGRGIKRPLGLLAERIGCRATFLWWFASRPAGHQHGRVPFVCPSRADVVAADRVCHCHRARRPPPSHPRCRSCTSLSAMYPLVGMAGCRLDDGTAVGSVQFVTLPPAPTVSRQLLPQLSDCHLQSSLPPMPVGMEGGRAPLRFPSSTLKGRVTKPTSRADSKGSFVCPEPGCGKQFSKKVRARSKSRSERGVHQRRNPCMIWGESTLQCGRALGSV